MNTLEFNYLPVLRGKEHIAPAWLRWRDKAYFAGGYVRWMVSPLVNPIPAGDIDIFPYTQSHYEQIIQELASYGMKPVFDSIVATTFSPVEYGPFKGCPALQIIKPINQGAIIVRGRLKEILDNFDFTVVRAGLLDLDEAMVDSAFMEDESTHYLRIKNIHCPISSTLRFMKYAKKGYTSNASEVLKLFLDWEQRPIEYITAIKEGLPRMRATGQDALRPEEIQQLTKLLYID